MCSTWTIIYACRYKIKISSTQLYYLKKYQIFLLDPYVPENISYRLLGVKVREDVAFAEEFNWCAV